MPDLKSPIAIWIKGFLFLLLGIVATSLLVFYGLTLVQGLLLVICIWAFCRFYYFAFYVIEHYVDDSYKFAGLIDFVKYALSNRKKNSHSRSNRT